MNPFDLFNAHIQQQAARELADQLRLGYHLGNAVHSFIQTLMPFRDQRSQQKAAVEPGWIEDCQESA